MTTYTAVSLTTLMPWTFGITTNTNMASNNGYQIIGSCTLTLPVSSNVNDIIRIAIGAACTLTLAQNINQFIIGPGGQTATGVGGSIVASEIGDTLELVATANNTSWQIISSLGSNLKFT